MIQTITMQNSKYSRKMLSILNEIVPGLFDITSTIQAERDTETGLCVCHILNGKDNKTYSFTDYLIPNTAHHNT